MKDKVIQVLLIEDNPGDIRIIKEMLGEAQGISYELDHQGRLQGGLMRLLNDGVDVVLLDLGLPDSQGLDTFSRLSVHARDVPVVILTGLEDEKTALKAVQMGAQDYLVKGSVDGHTLSRIIRYAIERKRTETKLRKSEEHYRLLVETMNEGFMELDENNVFRYVNEALCAMLAYNRKELIGQSITKFFDKTNQEILKKQFFLNEKSRNESYELTWTRMDKDRVHTVVSPRPISDTNGQSKGFFAVITNITRIKQMTKRLQEYTNALEAKAMKQTVKLREAQEELVRLKQALRK
jgi:PAS domain S-box-containing protein